MPQNSNFWLPRGHRFFPINGSYGYAAKSWWGPPRGHLGANGVPLGKKMGQNRKKLPCPKIRIVDDAAVIDYSQKMEVTVMAPNHGGDPLGAILGPMGSHWVQKMGQNVENYLAQNSNFRRPRGHRFFQKNGSFGYRAKSQWGPPRVHLGANGVPLGKKMGQNRKKLPCPKIRIFDYRAVIDFSQKMEVTVMTPNHGGDPLGSILGPMGSHWVKKWVKTVKNYHAPKFEFSTTHWLFWKKWKLRFWRQVTVRTP